MRPLGAVLFGFLGDRLGRKYTFLVTVTLMGAATAAVLRALADALRKLNPLHQLRNPVMFTVWICSAFTTGLWAQAALGRGEGRPSFILATSRSCSAPYSR